MKAGTRRHSHRFNSPQSLDVELRTLLGGVPTPRLSTGFEARLAVRIATAEDISDRPRRRPRSGAWLSAYWAVVAGATHWILAEIEWGAVPPPVVWYLAAGALSVLLPCVVLAWQSRPDWR